MSFLQSQCEVTDTTIADTLRLARHRMRYERQHIEPVGETGATAPGTDEQPEVGEIAPAPQAAPFVERPPINPSFVQRGLEVVRRGQ